MDNTKGITVDPDWIEEQNEIIKQAKLVVQMTRVVIESPYLGNHDMNEAYAEFAMHDCIVNYHESPYASHLLYTRRFVLNDDNESDRNLGIRAGFCWREVADKTVFYTDLGMTKGMQEGVEDCIMKGRSYELRILSIDLWKKFADYCMGCSYEIERNIK